MSATAKMTAITQILATQTKWAAEASKYFNDGVWGCPCDGCGKTYASVGRLSNHWDTKHPRSNRPVWISEVMLTLKGKTYEAKKAVKADGNKVDGVDYQTFKKEQFAILKAEHPQSTFNELNKMVAERWRQAKEVQATQSTVDTIEANEPKRPIPIPSNEWSQWIDRVNAVLSTMVPGAYLVPSPEGDGMVLFREPIEVAENLEGAQHLRDEAEGSNEAIEEILSDAEGSNEAVETLSDAEGSNEAIEETLSDAEGSNEAIEETLSDADDDADERSYDAELIECCKAWRTDGFLKAFRLLNKGKYSYKCQKQNKEGLPTRIYTVSKDGKPRQPTTLADIKDDLEHTFNELCWAWEDYKESPDYQEDEYDFDDDMEWLDVCSQLVNADNIEMFMD
jgi:hypothetical protein